MSEEQRDNLIQFVRDNIVKNKRLKIERANGDKLSIGILVYVSTENKEKRNLDAVNWEGPFTITDILGDEVLLKERPGLSYHKSRLKLKQNQ